MNQDSRLSLEEHPDPADERYVHDGLANYNVARLGHGYDFHKVAIFVRGADNAIAGGLVGEI